MLTIIITLDKVVVLYCQQTYQFITRLDSLASNSELGNALIAPLNEAVKIY